MNPCKNKTNALLRKTENANVLQKDLVPKGKVWISISVFKTFQHENVRVVVLSKNTPFFLLSLKK